MWKQLDCVPSPPPARLYRWRRWRESTLTCWKERNEMKKIALIVLAIVAALVLMIAAAFISANNRAVSAEEQVSSAAADVQVAEKRRVDLVYNLADVVKSYQNYEGDTLTRITQARTAAASGKVEEAQVTLNAVAEQYPELKANENYKQLMTELALTENQIAQYRNNYNQQVRAYNKLVRSFPTGFLLRVMNYQTIDTTYTDYDAPEDAPQNLFGDSDGD
nr:MAG TPA: LemA family [Caudoviricetes sp.]